jgi:lysophospholipase L1-like esterase
MKRILKLIFIFSIGFNIQGIIGQGKLNDPKKVKKILFLGNSITYSGQYITYCETFFRLKYPKNKYEFINCGLPSETVSGLSEPNHADGRFPRPALQERLARVLAQTKPDLVFASYGMNDGIYLPFDEDRFQKFKNGINWLHAEIESKKIPIIHLTPPIFDEKKDKEYAKVLDNYSNWLLEKSQKDGWQVADIHFPMKAFQETKRLTEPDFVLAKDGVHAGDLGHWIMAKQLLLYLGENEVEKISMPNELWAMYKNGSEILKLIEKRQSIMKDAWLTTIGHKRPEMNKGLPFKQAKKQAKEIGKSIDKLNK